MADARRGPRFVQYFGPVLEALKSLGGSARPREVEDAIVESLSISEGTQSSMLPSGGSRFKNDVHWARFYLVKAGLLDASKRGVWSLTDLGRETGLSQDQALKLFREIHSKFERKPRPESGDPGSEAGETSIDDFMDDSDDVETDHKSEILAILQSIPPDGFERLCQRLLRESGFEQVKVTGRSGDGGLDGHGVLRVNPLVSFYVYFQSKRYKASVGAPAIRDFRGAMLGRADKGIVMTTGTFTGEARKEAVRDGVPPIELVDGDALVEMLESLELGLIPRTVYDVNPEFFEEFGYELPGKTALES